MAKGRALKQLSSLYALQVKRVRIARNQGEEWITADQVQIGDRIRVKQGEWISVDGYVQSGMADADESMLTGESTTVAKAREDRVYAGTRCLVGSLDIVADKNHAGTRLSQMIGLIEIAKTITDELGGYGLFGVELFLTEDKVYFSEVSPRPHDTGLVTLVTQNLSEFALHFRAILGFPIPAPRRHRIR